MKSWWSGSLATFRSCDPKSILGTLSTRLVESHAINREAQIIAWRGQIALLLTATSDMSDDFVLLLEYPLLRLGRRIDAILLTRCAIVVLEFKVGERTVSPSARQQAEDYALDLQDFHAGSSNAPIVPIVVATDAHPRAQEWPLYWHHVSSVFDANSITLKPLLEELTSRVDRDGTPIDRNSWEAAPYRPVPTIVDAARTLYSRHGVDDLRSARADAANLTRTTAAMLAAISHARTNRQHAVIFITGIPGAGKTLCGLNAVFGTDAGAAFLTGNFPLVFVMRAALEGDAKDQGQDVRMARQKTESAIQPLMGFLRDNLDRSSPPHEHAIIFDEAQRAWDADFGAQKFGHSMSEAAMFLDIMQRHQDWAVIVALVGNGQEINTGEAGLSEWGDALLQRPNWTIYGPPGILRGQNSRERLFSTAIRPIEVNPDLHLDVPVRSVKSPASASWVDAVLLGDATLAKQIADAEGGVPFFLTRSLTSMKQYLRHVCRGSRRSGLVCSAGARRLRAEGIDPNFPHMDANAVANWFLSYWPDVRASDALEVPATQFACQGLELDYVGLCWGNDLIRRLGHHQWIPQKFVGSKWQSIGKEAAMAFKINTYRVLMTRFRYETVIWVPEGEARDITRHPVIFNDIADFLLQCGVRRLEDMDASEADPVAQSGLLV